MYCSLGMLASIEDENYYNQRQTYIFYIYTLVAFAILKTHHRRYRGRDPLQRCVYITRLISVRLVTACVSR